MVWPYEAVSSSPETFVFTLPPSLRAHSSRFPLGALVPPSISSAEPGLVLVLPTTGKLVFWESITSAASLDFTRQQRAGLEGSVGSIFSGDSIVQLVDVAPAGFVLGFGSGRLVLLTLRDSQGRPQIRVQTMRNQGYSTGSLFGGLKNVLVGGGWSKDVVAVHAAARQKREERDVVVITARGLIQIWTVRRGGQHALRQEFRAGPEMIAAIKQAVPDLERQPEDSFEILDFTVMPGPDGADRSDSDDAVAPRKLLVLVSSREVASAFYLLLEVWVTSDSVTIGYAHLVRSYTTTLQAQSNPWRPRVLLPRPPHAVSVIFDRAVVILSLGKQIRSPDHQLLVDMRRFPQAFEELLHFPEGQDIEIVGCGPEDASDANSSNADLDHRRRTPHPACVLLLRGVGVVRVTITLPDAKGTLANQDRLPVKSRIEQAIAYGTQPHNPLSFAARPDVMPSPEEVETAALEVSAEILSSNSMAIVHLTPSMEHNLQQRAAALKELASYIKRNFSPISRLTKWKLLWDAEKMAAAKVVWKRHEDRLKRGTSEPEKIHLAELIDMLHHKFKDAPNPQRGELDKVRHWFTKDIGTIHYIVPWSVRVIKELYGDGQQDMPSILNLLTQAQDVFLGALTTAYAFRQDNASRYGLDEESLQDGLLQAEGYNDLPPFWTSTKEIVEASKTIVKYNLAIVQKCLPRPGSSGTGANRHVVSRILKESPSLVEICCKSYIERYRWKSAQVDVPMKAEGLILRKEHLELRHSHLIKLAGLGLVDAAIQLAERYDDMDTLVTLIGEAISREADAAEDKSVLEEERKRHHQRFNMLQDQFTSYFTRFGDRWAAALFTQQIQHRRLGSLMDDHSEWQPYLTTFLRANPAYAKLSWINDVIGEKDFRSASNVLLDVASVKEQDVWSKKVQISLGKLSLLAAGGTTPADRRNLAPKTYRVERVDREFELIDAQERLYRHVTPSIREAIDETAEIDLVKKDFGSQVSKDRRALSNVLDEGLTLLVRRQPMTAEMLIQLLTLIDHHYDLDQTSGLTGHEFYLALRLTMIVRAEDEAKATLLERIIWRRCMIRDDWAVINDTRLKDDQAVEQSTGDTALFITVRAGFQTGEYLFLIFPPPRLRLVGIF